MSFDGNSYACHDHHNLAGIEVMFLAAMKACYVMVILSDDYYEGNAMNRNLFPLIFI